MDSISTTGGQKEKEKENKKEKENEYETKYSPVGKFKQLYEENVGLVNGIVAQWLIELSEDIDYDLFKRAVEIATDRGKPTPEQLEEARKSFEELRSRK